jgi:hypothetical protein
VFVDIETIIRTKGNNHSNFCFNFGIYTLGLSSGYQAMGSSGAQAGHGISDLPQLTGEDLKMLDSFDQVRSRGEGSQFQYRSLPPGAQPQQTSTTLNYHGNRVVL